MDHTDYHPERDTEPLFSLAEIVAILDDVRGMSIMGSADNYGTIRDFTCESVEFRANILANTKRREAQ